MRPGSALHPASEGPEGLSGTLEVCVRFMFVSDYKGNNVHY